VPWVWGTTGPDLQPKCTGKPVDSWQALSTLPTRQVVHARQHARRIHRRLQILGFEGRQHRSVADRAATNKLQEQKPLLAGYNSTNYADLVSQGQACVSEAWGGASTAKVVETHRVHYVIPKEGGTLWTDGCQSPRAPVHSDALQVISFTLRPEIAALATDDGSWPA